MGKLQAIEGMKTNWGGLWFQPGSNYFASQSISLSELRKFKGNVKLIVRKNKFYNGGENNRPNYVFCLADTNAEEALTLTPEKIDADEEVEYAWIDEHGSWVTGKGERLYTEEEVQYAINRASEDGMRGYGYGENLVSDYL